MEINQFHSEYIVKEEDNEDPSQDINIEDDEYFQEETQKITLFESAEDDLVIADEPIKQENDPLSLDEPMFFQFGPNGKAEFALLHSMGAKSGCVPSIPELSGFQDYLLDSKFQIEKGKKKSLLKTLYKVVLNSPFEKTKVSQKNIHSLLKHKVEKLPKREGVKSDEVDSETASDETKSVWHKCDHCEYLAISTDALVKHFKTAHHSYRFCLACDYRCLTNEQLARHKLHKCKASKKSSYTCIHCSYPVSTFHEMQRHTATEHGVFLSLDDRCVYLTDLIMLKKSMNFNVFKSPDEKDKESKKKVNSNITQIVNLEKEREKTFDILDTPFVEHQRVWYICDQCKYQTSIFSCLKMHVSTHHEGTRFPCNLCGYLATTESCLKRHKFNHHGGVRYDWDKLKKAAISVSKIPDEKDKKSKSKTNSPVNFTKYKEKKCDTEITSETTSEVKQSIWHICDQCEYQTSVFSSLKMHIATNHEGTRFPCNQCEYLATTESYLKRHKSTKHGGVSYFCDKCLYISSDPYDLETHKSSKHKIILTNHCDKCEFSSVSANVLKKHMKNKHKQKFKCAACDYKGSTTGHLDRHQSYLCKASKSMSKYSCLHCTYFVSTFAAMQKHTSTKHGLVLKFNDRSAYRTQILKSKKAKIIKQIDNKIIISPLTSQK